MPLVTLVMTTSLSLVASAEVRYQLVKRESCDLYKWQGFIQTFSVGVATPTEFLKFTCSEVASGAPKRLEISY